MFFGVKNNTSTNESNLKTRCGLTTVTMKILTTFVISVHFLRKYYTISGYLASHLGTQTNGAKILRKC